MEVDEIPSTNSGTGNITMKGYQSGDDFYISDVKNTGEKSYLSTTNYNEKATKEKKPFMPVK